MEVPIRIARDGGKPLPRRIRFTRDALAGIAPPVDKPEIVIHDTEAKGLVCRLKRSGSRAFYWYGRVRGESRPVKHYLGGDEMPIEKLRTLATKTLVDARQGINPNAMIRAKREADRSRQTVGHLWERYKAKVLYNSVDPATTKTRQTNESLWRVWLSSLADEPVEKITSDVVESFHEAVAKGKPDAKTQRGLGGKRTANKAVVLLKAIFHANKLPNPAKGVKLFEQHSRERYLSPDELKRFLAALANEPDQTARDLIEMAIFTGQRRANVQSMEWAELDLQAAIWRIPASKAKARKPIEVALAAPAIEILNERMKTNQLRDIPSRFVFWSDTSKSGFMMEPRYAMARACEQAGISDFRFHDLRRTMGSWQAALGTSDTIIGKSLGHAPGSKATSVYARVDLTPVRQSVGAAVDAMLIAAGRKAPEQPKDQSAKGGRSKKQK